MPYALYASETSLHTPRAGLWHRTGVKKSPPSFASVIGDPDAHGWHPGLFESPARPVCAGPGTGLGSCGYVVGVSRSEGAAGGAGCRPRRKGKSSLVTGQARLRQFLVGDTSGLWWLCNLGPFISAQNVTARPGRTPSPAAGCSSDLLHRVLWGSL